LHGSLASKAPGMELDWPNLITGQRLLVDRADEGQELCSALQNAVGSDPCMEDRDHLSIFRTLHQTSMHFSSVIAPDPSYISRHSTLRKAFGLDWQLFMAGFGGWD
jgi:hypothetical protein